MLTISFLVFISTSTKCLSFFKCDHIVSEVREPFDMGTLHYNRPLPSSPETAKFDLTRPQVDTDEYFLEKDYSIDCDSDTYKAVRIYALFMIAVCECPSSGLPDHDGPTFS